MFSRERILKGLKWIGITLGVVLILGTLWRIPYVLEKEKTQEVVAKIHTTKLTIEDVMGKNLPPDPGVEADKTVAGIDANKNNIRDDVELAIFKEYPDSPKTRAALLQYAMALQMEFVQPFFNTEIVVAAIQREDLAYVCVGKTLSRSDLVEYLKNGESLRLFVYEKQINTKERIQVRKDFYAKIGSYESLEHNCDIDYSTF